MTKFKPMWEMTKISARDLEAIESGGENEVSIPNMAFGDPETDLLKFQIPKFQRGLRWSVPKRKRFLHSLRQGQPTGILVFARTKDEKSNGKVVKCWFVLDGQQRIATISLLIKEFWKNNHYELDKHHLESLCDALSVEKTESETLEKALQEICNPDNGDSFNLSALNNTSRFLANWVKKANFAYPTEEEKENAAIEVVANIGNSLKDQYEGLREFELPAMLIRIPETMSEREVLTEIFENLNDNVPLKKNELLAAHWERYLISWPPKLTGTYHNNFLTNLLSAMEERITKSYKVGEEEGDYEYLPDVEILNEENISFYDFFYSLGVTSHKNHELKIREVFNIGAEGKEGPDEDLGLNAFRLYLTNTLNQTSDPRIEHYFTTPLEPFHMDNQERAEIGPAIDAFTSSLNSIETALKDVTRFNLKTRNQKVIGTTAAATYVATYMKLVHDGQLQPRTNDIPVGNDMVTIATIKNLFKTHLTKWWYRDLLSGDFVGSNAYQNAARRVSPEGGNSSSPNTTMCLPPKENDFFILFRQVFLDEYELKHDEPVRQRRITDRTKATMHLIHSNYQSNEPVDLDHLIPFHARYEDGGSRLKHRLALNHIANYMPVSTAKNRERKNEPWYDYIDQINDQAEKKAIKENLLLPIDYFKDETRENSHLFDQFLVKRWTLIVDRVLTQLFQKKWIEQSKEDRHNKLREELVKHILESLGRESQIDDYLIKLEELPNAV